MPSLKIQDAKNSILNQHEPIQTMNTKIKVYSLEWNWSDGSDDSTLSNLVTVGACPFEVWGWEDEWTESQTEFDARIHYWFEDMDELKAHCGNDGKSDWYIKSYEFDHDNDLADIK